MNYRTEQESEAEYAEWVESLPVCDECKKEPGVWFIQDKKSGTGYRLCEKCSASQGWEPCTLHLPPEEED